MSWGTAASDWGSRGIPKLNFPNPPQAVSAPLDLFTTTIRTLDALRAGVASTIKEGIYDPVQGVLTGDWETYRPSYTDWYTQFDERQTATQLFEELTPDFSGGFLEDLAYGRTRQAVGFGVDVGMDPTTYLVGPGSITAKAAARRIAADVVPGTTTSRAAVEWGLKQGDQRIKQGLEDLDALMPKRPKKIGDPVTAPLQWSDEAQVVGRDLAAYAAEKGYVAPVEEALSVMAARGGGVSKIKNREMVEHLIGAKSTGIRFNLFWRQTARKELLSHEKTEVLYRPLRAIAGTVTRSKPYQSAAGKFGSERLAGLRRQFDATPEDAVAARVALLRDMGNVQRIQRQRNAWSGRAYQTITGVTGQFDHSNVKLTAAVRLLGHGLGSADGVNLRSVNFADLGDIRPDVDRQVALLGGKDEAQRLTSMLDSFFRTVREDGIKTGISIGKRGNYTPCFSTRKRSKN